MIIGIDIGGTFTDFTTIDDAGRMHVHKRLTTPDDPARAVLDGLRELNAAPDAVIVHGSTIATNALLERKGARTALITTRGFADVIEIGRQNRPQLYALEPVKAIPLVPRELRFEVDERIAADGSVLRKLDPTQLEECIQQVIDAKVESLAVCLLFSFLTPDHEQQVKQALIDADAQPFISLSCEVLPEYREYERTSTTVINAYVAPLVARYLARLETELSGRTLRIMQSNGGVISASTAAAQAARTALSGPAGGVVGAFQIAQRAFAPPPSPDPSPTRERDGVRAVRVITFDMGGTSTDVALCDDALPTTSEGEIASLPLRLPMIDIHTVGAGGGSIARIDAGGALTVGPQSAGAMPGAACYDNGGQHATVTDANLVLKRLDAKHFLGGAMTLNAEAAQNAIHALRKTSDIAETAWGIIRVANATMERAVRKISVERGHDPRRFTLVAFGGAGPLHACELAAELRISRILIPPAPGVLSALGMATADTVKDYSRAVLRHARDIADDEFNDLFVELETRGHEELLREGIDTQDIILQRAVDLRYVGQSYEITVEAKRNDTQARYLEAFHQLHAMRYGHSHPEQAVEIVTVRVKAVGRADQVEVKAIQSGAEDASTAMLGKEEVWFEDGAVNTKHYDRDRLRAGHLIRGAAIIFQLDTTTVIPPDWIARVDGFENLIIERR